MIKYLIVFFICAIKLQATTFYVDATNGNDSNNGTSQFTPWKTLSKVSSMGVSFQPGDIIALKRGEVWKGERIKSANHSSGTEFAPITYTAYGSGEKPIIDLIVEQFVSWSNEGNNIWSTVTDNYSRFFKNGTEMLRAVKFNDIGLYGTEYHTNGGKLYIYSTTDPSNDKFSWAKYSEAFRLAGANYINIENLNIQGGSNASLRLLNNNGWGITNCTIGKNAGYGIVVKNSSKILIDNVMLDANFMLNQSQYPPGSSGIDYTGCSDGIFVSSGTSEITIRNCFFKNWSHASFGSNTEDSSNKITNIKFYNNELTSPDIIYGGRIAYSGYSEDGEYYNNYIHDISVANQLGGSRNHFHHNIIDGVSDSPLKNDHIGIGIWMQNYNVQIKDNIIENNIIANTESKGFEIYSINWDKPNEFSGNVFRNNILYNCGTKENNIAIQFHKDKNGEKIYNNIITNNLIYNSNTIQTCLYQYNGDLLDVTAFNNRDDDIKNNISGNPLFVDIANGDYHITENSPCIDAGETPLAIQDFDGNIISSYQTLPDIGIYEFQKPTSVINVHNTNKEIAVYPNPVKAVLNITHNNSTIIKDVIIYNCLGEIVKRGISSGGVISTSNLSNGLYVLRINTSAGEVIKKIIVNKR